MGKIAHDYRTGRGQLSVAFQAQIVVAFGEQLLVDRTMDVVAHGASLAQGLVLKDVRPGLGPVTLSASLVHASHEHTLGLVNILPVGVVAMSAAYPSFFDRVAVLQVEQCFGLKMTLETSFRIFAGIDDELAPTSTHFQVEATGAMTRFAALTLPALPFSRNLNARVAGVFEILNHLLVAQSARFHPYVLSTLNQGRGGDHALHRRAGNNEYHCCGSHEASH
jgi:hypothetical protein